MLKPYKRPNHPIKDPLNPVDDTDNSLHTHLAEIVRNERDPRFKASRQKEYDGILAKCGVKLIYRTEFLKNAIMIGNCFVLTIKEPGTTNPTCKARWILQGHQDRYRYSIANDSPMLLRHMFRVIVSLSVVLFSCILWTRDVEQFCMLSHPLQPDVFTDASPEARFSKDQVLKIELPNYGLVEACSSFFDTYYPLRTKQLDMKCSSFDRCFLCKISNNVATGVTRLASDDSINTGDREYGEEEEQATKKVITRRNGKSMLRYLGFVTDKNNDSIDLYQDTHIVRLQYL